MSNNTTNEIVAFFKGRKGVCESVYQHDYGRVMVLDDREYIDPFDAYFEVSGADEAIPVVGRENRVAIPNECLANSGKVTLHIPIHEGENDSEVEDIITFRVIGRAKPIDDGTPAEQSALAQAIALLKRPITYIEQIVNEALAFTGTTFDQFREEMDTFKDTLIQGVRPDTVKTLWTGTIDNDHQTATLNETAANFDYLDIYLEGPPNKIQRVKSVPAGTAENIEVSLSSFDDGLMKLWSSKMTIVVSGTTVAYSSASSYNWDGSQSYESPYLTNTAHFKITKIEGVKIASQTPAELTDIRIGEDGTSYSSAGNAVRAQIADVKSDINDIEAVLRNDGSYAFNNIGYINANGSVNGSDGGRYTDLIPLVGVKSITYKVNLGTSGCGLAFFDEGKNFVSNISILGGTGESGSTLSITDTIRNSAAYFIASHYANTSWQPACSVLVDDNSIAKRLDAIEDTYVSKDAIQTAVGLNKFDIDAVTVGKEVYGDGTLKVESNSAISDYIPVDGASNIYIKNLPIYSGSGMTSRSAFFYDASKSAVGSRVLIPIGASSYSVDVPSNAEYFVFSIYQRASSSELPLDFSNVMLTFEPTDIQFEPYTLYAAEIEGYKIKGDSDSDSSGTSGLKVVIFGDSITETASMDDDGTDYVEGTRHNWPEYANGYMGWGSFKNYAKTGAAYKDRPNLEYRQSVSNQIAIAMADSNNDDADIIIFSLGTNDGTSSLGSYETAMGKATLADLDRTNLYEALRYAYWSIRSKYKNAVCFAAIPIQRADIEPPTALYEAIEKMAHRYDFIIINGAYQSGIVKENNVWNASGNDLEDGLHPNTTGQIKMAKLYSSVILRNYLWRK